MVAKPIGVLVLLAAVLLGALEQHGGDRAGRGSLTFLCVDLHIESGHGIQQALRLRGQATATGRDGYPAGIHHAHYAASASASIGIAALAIEWRRRLVLGLALLRPWWQKGCG